MIKSVRASHNRDLFGCKQEGGGKDREKEWHNRKTRKIFIINLTEVISRKRNRREKIIEVGGKKVKGMRAGAGGREENKHETEKEEEGDRKRKRQMGIRLRGHLLRGRGNLNLQIDCCPALTAVSGSLWQPLLWGKKAERERGNRLYVPLTGQLGCSFTHAAEHKPLVIHTHTHTSSSHAMTRRSHTKYTLNLHRYPQNNCNFNAGTMSSDMEFPSVCFYTLFRLLCVSNSRYARLVVKSVKCHCPG